MKILPTAIVVMIAMTAFVARADEPTTHPDEKLFTLHFKDTPVTEVLQELQRQSGIELHTGTVATRRANRTHVDIDVENQPFWRALAQVIEPLSLRPQEFKSAPPSMVLTAQSPGWTMPYFFVNGPLAVTMNRVQRDAEIDYAPPAAVSSGGCRVVFDVFPQPTLDAKQLLGITVTRCVDESGKALDCREFDDPQEKQFPIRHQIFVRPGAARTIVELRGEVVLLLENGNEKRFAFLFRDIPLPPLRSPMIVATSRPAPPLPAPSPELPVDYPKRVAALVTQLSAVSSDERLSGRIGLAMLPPAAFGAIESAAKQKELPPSVSRILSAIYVKQKSWRQARAQHDAAEAEMNAWEETLARETYARMGHRNPAWDQQAVDAIHAMFNWTERTDVPRVRRVFESAIDAGCDDPMILSLAANSFEHGGRPLDDCFSYYSHAEAGMAKEDYPAFFRLQNAMRQGALRLMFADLDSQEKNQTTLSVDQWTLILQQEKQVLDLWPAAVRQGMPIPMLKVMSARVLNMFSQQNRDAEAAFKIVMDSLEAVRPGEEFLRRTRGYYLVQWAWQGRGRGTVDQVAPDGFKLFADRLRQAEVELNKAYKLDPTDSEVSAQMMQVCLGRSYPRPVMEEWFESAMAADPTNIEACDFKVNYIRPAWFGSVAQVQQFTEACYSGDNWRTGIPFLKATSFQSFLMGMKKEDWSAYLGGPEVWTNIRDVYEPYLLAEPEDIEVRAKYCQFACRARHLDVARKQFEMLGVYRPILIFHTPGAIERYEKLAATGEDPKN